MLLFVGALIVIGSVIGGFMMHGGNPLVLNQPTEFIIIGGAALGSVVISTPIKVLKAIVAQLKALLGSAPAKQDYLDLLALMYQLFRVIQQSGIMSLESHVEKPTESAILSRYPKFLGRHESAAFLADSVKVMILGGISAFDLESLMDADLEVHHAEALKAGGAVNKVSDAMPGLGIVAAVLGIVITMGIIDGPPAEIGHSVAAALVGTFLGILISYGFLGPLATSLEHRVDDEGRYEQCIKAGLLSVYKGLPPAIAVEFARRVLPHDVRPSFEETEVACKSSKAEPAAAAA